MKENGRPDLIHPVDTRSRLKNSSSVPPHLTSKANIKKNTATPYWNHGANLKDYKYQYYEKKADKIHDLISLYEKDQTLVFGYQDYKGRETNHIIYFELPDSGEQISFHCTLSKTDDIPVYGKAWDGVQNSTLPKIEKDIELLYGEELRQSYAS